MAIRTARFLFLLTHELGHIVGGTFCGGSLKSADLLPWHPPHTATLDLSYDSESLVRNSLSLHKILDRLASA
jgi:hypothetical protein